MKTRALNTTFALLAAAFLFASCEDSPMGPSSNEQPTEEFPTTYPPIPRPSSPDETIPDESEVYTAISPIAGKNIDFAPVWSDGVFTWNVDIQTQYDRVIGGWGGDAPGDYWNGTTHNEQLTFEGGVVDLRRPVPFGTSYGDPHPRRILFVEAGEAIATPRNPDKDYVLFQFQSYPERRFNGALFGGYSILEVEPAFGERTRQRAYYVAAMSCPQITNAVYIKRERWWKRLPMISEGQTLKSIIVDEGATFGVEYTRTQGTSFQSAYTFTRTLNAEVPLGSTGAKLGGSLSEAFGTTKTVSEESAVTVSRDMTGIPGKTVVYSVWSSVERYTVVDAAGNPYTDPSFTFEDLGTALIQGEYEWISSTQFDAE